MSRTSLGEAKRKIRKLKQTEQKIRRVEIGSGAALVWDDFFTVKYPAASVAEMDRQTYKTVVEEFFYNVYYRYFSENPAGAVGIYDPEILSRLGLRPDADMRMIRAKFRELAKLYHPDAGGDGADFIKLMDDYKNLTGK